MRREEFVECLSRYQGMPPFAIENSNHRIVKCSCGKTHSKELFGKGCPGWTTEPKSAKELKKERADETREDAIEHSRRVREWRRKNGYRPSPAERNPLVSVDAEDEPINTTPPKERKHDRKR